MPYKDKDKQKKQKRKAHLLSAYGLSTDQYNKMFVDQQGECDLCGIHQKELNHALCVDHCHVTANIRGLLCKKM